MYLPRSRRSIIHGEFTRVSRPGQTHWKKKDFFWRLSLAVTSPSTCMWLFWTKGSKSLRHPIYSDWVGP